jgi:molecular chaperone IbpA
MFAKNELVPFVNDLRKNVIGFDHLWDDLIHYPLSTLDSTFPKDNLIQLENTVIIEIALAGFSKEDISIERDNASLIVVGTKKEEEVDKDAHFIYKNIAQRSFKKRYTVGAEYGDIRARFKDGILSIHLEKEPEKETKQTVEIK